MLGELKNADFMKIFTKYVSGSNLLYIYKELSKLSKKAKNSFLNGQKLSKSIIKEDMCTTDKYMK
jgi:hypothetical protein